MTDRKPFRRARSSVTGRFVSLAFAAKYPETTVVETVEPRGAERVGG